MDLRHIRTFVTVAELGTVDVLVNGGPGIDDLAQGESANADLPSGTYTFTVTSADGSVTVATLENVPVVAGELLQVFAVGAFPDESGENPFQAVTNTVALQQEESSTVAPASPAPDAPGAAPQSASQSASPRFTG